MDPLSAIKMFTASPASGLSSKAVQDAAASMTKTIPPAEMQKLTSINSDAPLGPSPSISSASGANFENMLGGFVNDVAQKQAAAGTAITGLLSGQNVSLHQAMISMEEANVSFQMMVEVRNRLMDGYQELMRMQI